MNATELFDKYRNLFGALIYFLIGSFIAVYAYYIAPRFVMTADLVSFEKMFDDEIVSARNKSGSATPPVPIQRSWSAYGPCPRFCFTSTGSLESDPISLDTELA